MTTIKTNLPHNIRSFPPTKYF